MEHFLRDIELGKPIFVFLYFLPTLVALLRRGAAPNRQVPIGVVFLVDLFFAWTVIGWIVAMALAFREQGFVSNANDSAPRSDWQNLPQIWGSQESEQPVWEPQEWQPPQPLATEWASPEPLAPCLRCQDQGEICPICHGNRGWHELPTGENGTATWVSCARCCGSGRVQCTLCGKTGYG